MELRSTRIRRRAAACAGALVAIAVAVPAALLGAGVASAAAASAGRSPSLVTGSRYLVAAGNLIDGHYYQSFPGTADFGLTIDGALALAATGDDDAALRTIVAFLDDQGTDPSGDTVNEWTGIGTSYVSGGAIGKEALLAEVVGANPRQFGGHDLIAALNATVCARASGGANPVCPAAGSYRNDTSMFDQALGVIAQLRAGQAGAASKPIAYLESLQNTNGSFPALIPPSGGGDVDSSAMAVMALALVPGPQAAADVTAGIDWIAGEQERSGGFPDAGAESTNSTGLAIQALTLRAAAQRARIDSALAFLAAEQNGNGGFNADAGQPGSNLRASTQAVGGAVGTPFGTLRIDLNRAASAHPSPSGSGGTASSARQPGPTSGASHTASASGQPSTRPTASAAATGARSGLSASHATATPGPGAQPTASGALAAASASGTHAAAAPSGGSSALVIAIAAVVAAVIVVGSLIIGRRQRLRERRRLEHREDEPENTAAATDGAASPETADAGASDEVSS
jgi:hypothetical protein